MTEPAPGYHIADQGWHYMVPATTAIGGFDPETVANELLMWSERLVGVEGAVIHMVTDSGLKLVWAGGPARLPSDARMIDREHPGPIARTSRQATTQVVSDEGDLSSPAIHGFGWRSAVCVPLVVDETVVGVFSAGWRAPFLVTSEVRVVLEAAASLGSALLGRIELLHRVKQEEHKLRAVIDGLPVAASIIDMETLRVRWQNGHAERLFGNIASATAHDLFPPAGTAPLTDETDAFPSARLRSFLRGETAPGRITIRTVDDQRRVLTPSVAQIDDRSAVVIHVDVTHDAHMEQERSRFVRMVSHHLRTPLTPLLGYISLLVGDKTDDNLREEAAAAMTSSVAHLSDLVNRLEQIASLRPVDPAAMGQHRIGDLVQEAWSSVEQAPPDSLRVSGESAVLVNCAKSHAVGAFRELFANAVTHGTPPVDLSITVDNDVHIRVSDAGVGITAEWEKAVFAPFLSAQDGYLAPESEHIGLGLNLARGLISATGGELSYSGDAFWVRLKSVEA